uniref:Uncharacterized protein n=1 Tax=Arundo donax TaxID=35708 RepID=A0A0A9B8T6_ARUDO
MLCLKMTSNPPRELPYLFRRTTEGCKTMLDKEFKK